MRSVSRQRRVAQQNGRSECGVGSLVNDNDCPSVTIDDTGLSRDIQGYRRKCSGRRGATLQGRGCHYEAERQQAAVFSTSRGHQVANFGVAHWRRRAVDRSAKRFLTAFVSTAVRARHKLRDDHGGVTLRREKPSRRCSNSGRPASADVGKSARRHSRTGEPPPVIHQLAPRMRDGCGGHPDASDWPTRAYIRRAGAAPGYTNSVNRSRRPHKLLQIRKFESSRHGVARLILPGFAFGVGANSLTVRREENPCAARLQTGFGHDSDGHRNRIGT